MRSCLELVVLQKNYGNSIYQMAHPYVIYGDPAYGISRNILAPFCGSQLTTQQLEFNKSMSQVRICVSGASKNLPVLLLC